MKKILFIADLHVKVGQKNVPIEWQINRFISLAKVLKQKFVEHNCTHLMLGGDIFDTAKPTPLEYELLTKFFVELGDIGGYLYTGNHEMVNNKLSIISQLTTLFSKIAPNFEIVEKGYRSEDFDVINYEEIKQKEWKSAKSTLCFTHVRGNIPPHVVPEIDLTKFVNHGYSLVIAGDLHSYENTQEIENTGVKIVYPGSPLNTSFTRTRSTNTNGYLVIDTDSHNVEWFSLDNLPKLILKEVSVSDSMEKDPYDHVMYEVTGDVLELKDVNNELVKSKVNNIINMEAKLQLRNKSLIEELKMLWSDVYNLKENRIDVLAGLLAMYDTKNND